MTLAKGLVQSVGADHVSFTGHSLGGRLAAVSSVATGCPAVTFDAAGVSNSELAVALGAKGQYVSLLPYVTGDFSRARSQAEGDIVNVSLESDPLTLLQKLAEVQRQMPLPGFGPPSIVSGAAALLDAVPGSLGRQDWVGASVVGPDHSLNSIERELEKQAIASPEQGS